MRFSSLSAALLFVALAASGFACAEGSTGDAIDVSPSTPEIEEDAGAGARLPPSNPPAETDDEEDEDAGKGDAGKDGGDTTCPAVNTCAGATNLGSISGDTRADVLTAEGSGSQWIVVRVTEDYHDLVGNSLEMKATLTSPSGTNFDLIVYQPSTGQECSTIAQQSTSTSAADTAGVEFGEGAVTNFGESDTRNVTIEVRHVSGPCNASAKWKLTVSGNQH